MVASTISQILIVYCKNIMEYAFIKQTSIDYALPYHIVETIYNKWYSEGLFYEKLEEQLRENNNNI